VQGARLRLIVVVIALAVSLVSAVGARAQSIATPPTLGALYHDGQTNRYLLGGTWLYRADLADTGVAAGLWRDVASTAGWSPVSVPNSYNAGDFSSASMTGWVGWYRRDFVLPAHAFPGYVPVRFRAWMIQFDSVNYRATVWLNGRKLGSHAGAFLPFSYLLGGLRPGINRLVVRVDNRRTPTDLPRGPGGGWWNYGGITQEVYLRPIARGDVSQVQVRPILPCPRCTAAVHEQVLVRNHTSARQTIALTGTYGSAKLSFGRRTLAPGATWNATAQVAIRRPRLWSIDRPYLYGVRLTLKDSSGRVLTQYYTDSGIRSIVRTPDGRLRLNGRLLDLRGFAIHEQTLATGAALSPQDMNNVVGWLRQLGAHLLRSHYPLNPYILQLADRYGILVWAEIPAYQTAPQYLSQPAWLASAYAMLRENILVNQNHPAVLLWSIANELRTPPNGAQARYIAGATALAKQLDPTRPVGIAISDWPGVACQAAYAPVDAIGFNNYFGWFDAGGGTTDDRDALSPFLDEFRACYPTKALFVTEWGVDANRLGPVEERGTYTFQTNTDLFDLSVYASKPWLSGTTYFTMQDFAARPGWAGGNPAGTPPFVQKGLVDLQGNLKPAFAPVAAVDKATVQIGP
jgi:beta-glucuronidase